AAGIELRVPPLRLCTDNGAMIAAVGDLLVRAGIVSRAACVCAAPGAAARARAARSCGAHRRAARVRAVVPVCRPRAGCAWIPFPSAFTQP
ncbi:hypothetical protein AB0D72_31030, partial [Streptomyces sp. NPDC048188]